MGKREWFGAAIAAFGVGCGEGSSADAQGEDIKDAKIEKAPEEILAQDEVIDEELYVPQLRPELVGTTPGKLQSSLDSKQDDVKHVEFQEVEFESPKFRNVLMEEADGVKPGDWMGDGYDDEVKRLKVKLPKELSENKFNNSLEQLHRFFVPREDEAKDGVIGLLDSVKEGKETRFFVNKEYKEQVKKFVEKYGARYDVPVEVIYGVIGIENGGKHDPRKNTADGAYGIMQVQPRVVEDLRRIFPKEDWSGVSVADIEGNIRAGAAYLSYLGGRYGQWSFALMAYNSGPGRFENRMAGGEEEKLKIRKKKGGWKKHLENKNLWWACSRNGRGFLENGNAGYAADAMYLGKPMREIMQSQGGEVKLTPLTDEMK